MSELKKLPEGWKWVNLGSVVEINPKLPNKESISDDTEVQFIPMKLVEELIGKIHLSEVRRYKEVKKGYTSFTNNDILFAKVTPCMENGKIAIASKLKNAIGFGSTEFHVLRPLKNISPNFIFYFVIQNTFRNKAANSMTGAVGLRRVPKAFLEEFKIQLPSFDIQNKIVKKIEELISELDKGSEYLNLAQQQLKIYRQSVLKSAFEGRFTNKNITFENYPDSWKTTTLIENCLKIQDGSHFSPPIQFDKPGHNRYKYITAKNIRNDYMDFRKLTYVNKDFHESIYNRCNPEYGDVLLTKDGVNTGEVTLNQLREPFSLLSSVCLFKTNKNILNNEYLKYFIQSPLGAKAIQNSMTGTAIKRIVLRKIKNSFFPLPTLNEQLRIVAAIETRLSVINKIEEDIVKNLKLSDLLKQSIMRKAFEGKLNYE